MRKEQYFYINEASCFMKNDKPNAAPMRDENPIPKPPVVQQDFYSEWIIESASDAFVNCLMSKKTINYEGTEGSSPLIPSVKIRIFLI